MPSIAMTDAASPVTSLLGCVVRAAREEWSGSIVVHLPDCALGEVVMVRGKVAWAACSEQSENLGSLLCRFAHISAAELSTVNKLYQQERGKKKMGAILEEQGLMARPVLHRCLMLHIRFALASLLSYQDSLVEPRPGAIATDAQHLFLPEEVLPFGVARDLALRWEASRWELSPLDSDHDWKRITSEHHLLKPFFALPGYRCAAIVSSHGGVVAAHRSAAGVNPLFLGVLVASHLESAGELSSGAELGATRATFLECDEGLLAARWVNPSALFACAVLTDGRGELGSLTAATGEVSKRVVSWIREAGPEVIEWD